MLYIKNTVLPCSGLFLDQLSRHYFMPFYISLFLFNTFLDHRSHISVFFNPPLFVLVSLFPSCVREPEENVSRKIESGRGRRGELGETEDSESNCRCSEQTRLGMFTELLTPWKSQHAFTQVQAGPE